jgi:hypothetical protein
LIELKFFAQLMGNPAQGLKNKPCERVKGSFQQSYPQLFGVTLKSPKNQ